MDPNNILYQQELASQLYWLGLAAIAGSLMFGYYLGRRTFGTPAFAVPLAGIIMMSIVMGILGSMTSFVIPFWMMIAAFGGYYVGYRSAKRDKEDSF